MYFRSGFEKTMTFFSEKFLPNLGCSVDKAKSERPGEICLSMISAHSRMGQICFIITYTYFIIRSTFSLFVPRLLEMGEIQLTEYENGRFGSL